MRDWLQEARVKKTMSLTEVAFRLGVTERAVDAWERGQRTPSRSHQLVLGTILGSDSIPAAFDQELKKALA